MKEAIVEKIRLVLESKREVLMRATLAARDAATNEESAPENKYDTRGLEASYLAGAQSRRLAELDSDLRTLERFAPRDFSNEEPVALGALVEIDDGDETRTVFLAPSGGGLTLELGAASIAVITPQSPLGQRLVGACEGDSIALASGRRNVEYEVVSVR